ncbi:MAG: agmatine deiminase family protein [Acidobacteria bacterium]|nr:agmatine deiminase family protein [Acidobacteriota bacterium]
MTPRGLGFRMPAEWEPHRATWLAWPHERSDWPGKFVPIPWVYGSFVRHLSQGERVCILVNGEDAREGARRVLAKSGANLDAVDFLVRTTDRSWTRDTCPSFVRNRETGEVAAVNWRFNAWAKYPNWRNDDGVGDFIARRRRLRQFKPVAPGDAGRRIVLEGGAIDVNGAGALLTSEECLLSEVQARNPGFGRGEMEDVFREWLGAEQVVWLNRGIDGDDTHGHVDDLARFTSPDTIAVASEPDRSDPNHEPLKENLARLRSLRRFRVVTLPMPAPVVFDGQRLPASYANFYIANGVVLVPTFNDPNDRVALDKLAALFPTRRVVGIHSLDLVLGLGTLHCMTQQEPA